MPTLEFEDGTVVAVGEVVVVVVVVVVAVTNVKFVADVATPSSVVTVTATEPAEAGGVTAVICVGESNTYDAAFTFPNFTDETHRKSDPVMTTVCPPAELPEEVPKAEIEGVGFVAYVYLKFAEPAVVPPGVVTRKYQSLAV